MSEFEGFGKIPRLSKGWLVSEKIDGTNAQIHIEDVTDDIGEHIVSLLLFLDGRVYAIRAGSRNRYITPEDDNFGFAGWVRANAYELIKLGPGRHFGEWAGPGIQKNPLDLPEKTLFMFNPRWIDQGPECVDVVPQLGIAENGAHLDLMFKSLYMTGTMVHNAGDLAQDPEGIIAYHIGSRQLYKRTFKQDGGKWQ